MLSSPGSCRLSAVCAARLALWLLPLAFLGFFFFLPLVRILAFGLSLKSLTPANLQLAADTLGFTFYQAALSTMLTLAVGLPAAALFAYYSFPGKALLARPHGGALHASHRRGGRGVQRLARSSRLAQSRA